MPPNNVALIMMFSFIFTGVDTHLSVHPARLEVDSEKLRQTMARHRHRILAFPHVSLQLSMPFSHSYNTDELLFIKTVLKIVLQMITKLLMFTYLQTFRPFRTSLQFFFCI